MDYREFLETLLGEKPEDNYIVIFTLPNQLPAFFKYVEEAAKYCESQRNVNGQHLYYGTNFLFRKPDKGRGKAEDSGGVCCFYMDVDIDTASPAHVKSDYPKNEAEAIELVKSIGFEPSLIVNSGYGLHVYWLFKEPWLFETDEDREKYHTLLLRLQATVKAKAEQKGWRLDSTGDLARILRVPGSYNWKIPDKPVEVRVIEHRPELRYNPENIEPFLVDETHIRRTKLPEEFKNQILNDFILNRDANPPLEKFEVLCEIEENFRLGWHAKRQQFGDDPSRYALSLATYAARANWTRQEMCDLLIAFYRKHLLNPLFTNRAGKEPISMERILRPVKLTHTIGKAILAAQAKEAERATQKETPEAKTEADPAPEQPAAAPPLAAAPDEKFENAAKAVSKMLHLEVRGIDCYIPEEGATREYVMKIETAGKIVDVAFRDVAQLHSQQAFNLRITDALQIVPKIASNDQWGIIRRLFAQITRVIFVTPKSDTVEGRMRVWIEEFLENRPPLTDIQGKQAKQPFVKGGHWWLLPGPFNQWSYHNKAKAEGESRTATCLKRAGLEYDEWYVHPPGGGPLKVRAYKVPHSIAIPPPDPPKLVVDNTRSESTHETNMESVEATP